MTADARHSGAYDRFLDSMKMDYEKWHDGIGYDLEALAELKGSERDDAERMLIAQRTSDWRVVEALAALGTPAAIGALKECLKANDHEIRIAAAEQLKDMGELQDIAPILEAALKKSSGIDPLFSRALDLIGGYKAVQTIPALLRIARSGDGEQAVLCVGMLYYLKGKTQEEFDWSQRPFFLRFNTSDRAERAAAFKELCAALEIDPGRA